MTMTSRKHITYDVFDPTIGVAVYTTRCACIARILAWWHDLDWCNTDVGWLYTIETTSYKVDDEDNNYIYIHPQYTYVYVVLTTLNN